MNENKNPNFQQFFDWTLISIFEACFAPTLTYSPATSEDFVTSGTSIRLLELWTSIFEACCAPTYSEVVIQYIIYNAFSRVVMHRVSALMLLRANAPSRVCSNRRLEVYSFNIFLHFYITLSTFKGGVILENRDIHLFLPWDRKIARTFTIFKINTSTKKQIHRQ